MVIMSHVSTPREQWPPTDGLIFSVEWFEPTRNDFGHYTVIYSYRVGDARFTGEFRDYTEVQD